MAKGGFLGSLGNLGGSILGGNSSSGGFLNRLFGTMMGTPQGAPQFPSYGLAAPDINQQNTALSDYSKNVLPLGEQMVSDTQRGSPEEQKLWDLTSGRYMNALLPRFTAAGVATSGPGLNAMTQGMQDLSTQYNQSRETMFQNAVKGLAGMEELPMQIRQSLIAAILGAPTYEKPAQPGLLQQIFGGGQSSMASGMSGAGAGLSSLFGGGGGAGVGAGGGMGYGSLPALPALAM